MNSSRPPLFSRHPDDALRRQPDDPLRRQEPGLQGQETPPSNFGDSVLIASGHNRSMSSLGNVSMDGTPGSRALQRKMQQFYPNSNSSPYGDNSEDEEANRNLDRFVQDAVYQIAPSVKVTNIGQNRYKIGDNTVTVDMNRSNDQIMARRGQQMVPLQLMLQDLYGSSGNSSGAGTPRQSSKPSTPRQVDDERAMLQRKLAAAGAAGAERRNTIPMMARPSVTGTSAPRRGMGVSPRRPSQIAGSRNALTPPGYRSGYTNMAVRR